MTDRIAYIDTVSTAQPTHGAEPWRAHCIRVAIALEEDRKIVGTVLMLVDPLAGVPIDPAWTTRYGVAGIPADDTKPPVLVAQVVCKMIAGAICVAQNHAFHRDVLGGLFEDAGVEGPEVAGHYCIQKEARPLVDARTMHGKKKAPTIAESYLHFTKEAMPWAVGMPWRDAALVQLNAVRTVFWALQEWGTPPDGIEYPAGV